MSKLEELIKEFCPNGVEYKKIEDVCVVETGGEPPKNSVKSKHPTDEYIYPIYSNGVGENALWGFSDSYRINIPSVTFSSIGTIGCPTLREIAFTPIIRLKVLYPKKNTELNVKFLKYALETVEFKQQKSSVPNINANLLKSIVIPLPALPVQREIVRILDSFTMYSDELKNRLNEELTARRKQYEFYRDKLLNFENTNLVFKNKKLKELCISIKDGMHNLPVTTDDNTGYPVLSAMNIYDGQIHYDAKRYVSKEVFEQESKRTKIETGDVLLTIVATIGRTAIVENSTSFLLQRSVCALKPSKEILSKYLKYYLDTNAIQNYMFANAHGSAQAGLYLNQVADIEVVLPPMEVQERIVKVLDNFDAICSDLGIGLPAEIEKRQKQYEYYREKLLTFDGKYATILTERNGTERNGTERNGTERNGTERNGQG